MQPKALSITRLANETGFSRNAIWTHKVRCLALSQRSVSLQQVSREGIDGIVLDLRQDKRRGRELWRFGKRKGIWAAMNAGLARSIQANEALLKAAPKQTATYHEDSSPDLDELALALADVPGAIEALKAWERSKNGHDKAIEAGGTAELEAISQEAPERASD